MLYGIAGMAAALMLAIGAAGIQTYRLQASEAAYDAMVAAGKAQAEVARKKAEGDAKLKAEKDRDYKARIAALTTRYNGLLNRPLSVNVPAPESPGSTDLACFDRAQLTGALNRFIGEVAGIAESGDQASIGLNASREWISELLRRQ
jgi:hypothetical protein